MRWRHAGAWRGLRFDMAPSRPGALLHSVRGRYSARRRPRVEAAPARESLRSNMRLTYGARALAIIPRVHTQCPHCLTIYRIGTGQLAESRGDVRCGHCRLSFSALETLADNLPDAQQPSLRFYSNAKSIELTQISRAALEPEAALFAPLPVSVSTSHDTGDERVPRSASARVGSPRIEAGYGNLTDEFDEAAIAAEFDAAFGTGPASGEVSGAFDENGWPLSGLSDAASDPVAAAWPGVVSAEAVVSTDAADGQILISETARTVRGSHRPLDRIAARRAHRDAIEQAPPAFARRRGPSPHAPAGWGWWLGSAVLLLTLGVQVAWAARAELLEVAALRPLLLRACETLRCPLPTVARRDAIVLAARDVRPHPSVADALIIGATLINEAEGSQPFPVIEITLSDVNEQRIAMRRFRPEEYVSDPRLVQRGIPASGTALFSVEVADPGKRAVAFEFRFL